MEFIRGLDSFITNLYTNESNLFSHCEDGVIDLKLFKKRAEVINNLDSVLSEFERIEKRITETLNKTKLIHEKNKTAFETILGIAKPPPVQDEWVTVTRKKKKNKKQSSDQTAPQITNEIKIAIDSKIKPAEKSRVKFTEALALNAISVPTFNYVEQNGELYYVESADHFAFKLAGHMFNGNIGMIYTEEKNPEKIKDCKFAESCIKKDKCDYYHDPVKFPGSRDHRNFIASSFLYSPPGSQFKNRTRGRRFGSREHIDTDIVGLQDEETCRFNDQCTHDILCALVLREYYSKTFTCQ